MISKKFKVSLNEVVGAKELTHYAAQIYRISPQKSDGKKIG